MSGGGSGMSGSGSGSRRGDLAVVMAAAALTGVSLFVYSNARLLRWDQPRRQRKEQERAGQQKGADAADANANANAAAAAGAGLAVVVKRDLARQGLTAVPREILSLRHLRELNLMANSLVELPEEIGGLSRLFRLGLKDNQLEALPESIGNLSELVELYLTNNRLRALPASMGRLKKLRKLHASFNSLEALPEAMRGMESLELFRAACNPGLEAVPPHLAQAPALTWLSLGGSRFCDSRNELDSVLDDSIASASVSLSSAATTTTTTGTPWWQQGPLPVVALADVERGAKLGDGASGDVFKAMWEGREVALKLFRGDTSPDGRAVDEMEVLCLVDHPGLTKVRAVVVAEAVAPVADEGEGGGGVRPAGVLMDLVAGQPLAEKPNATSVLRCRWPEGRTYPLSYLVAVGARLAGALQHLHGQGIMHGDVYAHNTVAAADGSGATLLDYGASFRYPRDGAGNSGRGCDFERLEVRAFGLLLADLWARCPEAQGQGQGQAGQQQLLQQQQEGMKAEVGSLIERCLSPRVAARPTFAEAARVLDKALRASNGGSKNAGGAGVKDGPRIPIE